MKFDDPAARRLCLVRHGTRTLCFHPPRPPLNGWTRLFRFWRKTETERESHVEGLDLLVTDDPASGAEAARRAAMAICRLALCGRNRIRIQD
jgi:hypothetical protein